MVSPDASRAVAEFVPGQAGRYIEVSMLARIFYCIALSLVVGIPIQTFAASGQAAHAFTSFDINDLNAARQEARSGSPVTQAALSELKQHADRMLRSPTTSVLDKRGVASSGDKRDFYAMGKYSWKDESEKASVDDAVYVRRDGARNPEAQGNEYDKKRFNEAVRFINGLTLAYYMTGEVSYAVKARAILRNWFISPDTRMNPNFRHAAVQPGVNDGIYGGIIEGVVLIEMLDYVALLEDGGQLKSGDVEGLKIWFGELADWLLTSPFGRSEARMKNNHGSWYRAQVMAFSMFAGKRESAHAQLALSRSLLENQIAEDGSMPNELKRADAGLYSVYGLRSLITLARLSDAIAPQQSLWHVERGDAPILRSALEYLAQYYIGGKQWTSKIRNQKPDPYAVQVFRLGSRAYPDKVTQNALLQLIRQMPATDRRARLLGPSL